MENRINIGEMDTLIKVYSCTIDRAAQAEKKFTYSLHSEVFAKVEQDVEESVSNTNLEAVASGTVTIYKIPGMTTRWQLDIHGVRYVIEGIDPVSRISALCRVSVRKLEVKRG